jgi:NADH dehydrogenase
MILVVGATGDLGQMITRLLVDTGQQVRALVRTSAAYDALSAGGVDAVMGDLKDPASLAAACDGMDAVVTTANSSARGGEDTVDSVDREGNRNLIDAAAGRGVERFLFVSALGADPTHPMPFLQAKGESEQALRRSGMSWIVVQPNMYMDKMIPIVVGPAFAGEPVTLVGEGVRQHSFVAARDVASLAVAALARPESDGQTLVIAGPQPISWRDVIAAFERVLGRDIAVRTVQPGTPVPHFPEIVTQLLAGLDTYDSPIDSAQVVETFGLSPTTLDDFARELATTHATAMPR